MTWPPASRPSRHYPTLPQVLHSAWSKAEAFIHPDSPGKPSTLDVPVLLVGQFLLTSASKSSRYSWGIL